MRKSWKLPASALDEMAVRAAADYPEETCGLLFDTDEALEVVAMENIQNRLHQKDPQHHRRDATRAFQFDAMALERVLRQREESGAPLVGIYHSHPDHDAYFSAKDREDAAPAGWGPIYPEAVHLVFAVKEGTTREVKGFAWSAAQEDFVEIEIVREDAD